MKSNGQDDIEKEFERLVPQPVPPGLRERVLGAALEARRATALTPRMRLAAAACLVMILAALGFGPILGRREAARLAALLDGRPEADGAAMKAGELAEMTGLERVDAERMVKLLSLASSAQRAERRSRLGEDLTEPKGWSAYEISQDLN